MKASGEFSYDSSVWWPSGTEKKDSYSNYSGELHSVHHSLHSISLIKGPIWSCGGVHAKVAVCVVHWDSVELEELFVDVSKNILPDESRWQDIPFLERLLGEQRSQFVRKQAFWKWYVLLNCSCVCFRAQWGGSRALLTLIGWKYLSSDEYSDDNDNDHPTHRKRVSPTSISFQAPGSNGGLPAFRPQFALERLSEPLRGRLAYIGLRVRKYGEGPKVERDTTMTHDYRACHQERD
jgi:hypothetical protein